MTLPDDREQGPAKMSKQFMTCTNRQISSKASCDVYAYDCVPPNCCVVDQIPIPCKERHCVWNDQAYKAICDPQMVEIGKKIANELDIVMSVEEHLASMDQSLDQFNRTMYRNQLAPNSCSYSQVAGTSAAVPIAFGVGILLGKYPKKFKSFCNCVGSSLFWVCRNGYNLVGNVVQYICSRNRNGGPASGPDRTRSTGPAAGAAIAGPNESTGQSADISQSETSVIGQGSFGAAGAIPYPAGVTPRVILYESSRSNETAGVRAAARAITMQDPPAAPPTTATAITFEEPTPNGTRAITFEETTVGAAAAIPSAPPIDAQPASYNSSASCDPVAARTRSKSKNCNGATGAATGKKEKKNASKSKNTKISKK